MSDRVAVLVVNFETRDALGQCLRSVAAARPAEIIVVDNASSDGSAASVASEFPAARLIANRTNVGFGAAVNQAAEATNAEILLVLNADTEIAPDSVEELAAFLETHPKAAVVGPRLVKRNGERHSTCRPFPGTLRWVVDNEDVAPLLTWIPGFRERSYVVWSHDRERRVPWFVGAAFAIRKSAFASVGGFDERYFLYFEEVDLFHRLGERGWEIHFAPVTSVLHRGGESTRLARADNEVRLLAGHLLFLRLHASPVRRALSIAALKVLDLFRLTVRSLAWLRAGNERARESARQDLSASARRLLHTW